MLCCLPSIAVSANAPYQLWGVDIVSHTIPVLSLGFNVTVLGAVDHALFDLG